MENTNVNNLIEEGKKQLAALQVELTKLADTAEKAVGVKAEEVSKQAEVLIGEAKTKIEEKTKEITATDEFKNLESEGKKALEEVEVKLNELSTQLESVTKDISSKLTNLFAGK